MAFFILFMFLLMLMFGGIAVDVMRFETRRVALQQTMDRAALAAASLKQTLTPANVFNDYFAKAGLGTSLKMVNYTTPTVTVSSTGNNSFRMVRAESSVRSYNYFMHLLRVDYLEGPATSQAEQGVSQIEIILVLDISGSMNDNNKIGGLRTAATDFVNTVKANDTLNQVSIGIVPYNAQVNLGQQLRSQFNASFLPTVAGVPNSSFPGVNCLEITPAAYSTTGLSQTTAIPMAAHADTLSTSTSTSYVPWSNSGALPVDDRLNRICNPRTNGAGVVLLPTKNKTPVLAAISALTAGGYTSIMLGMRWGAALIDEDARPIYTAIGDGTVAGRPAQNSDALTRKIIVLMTDGEHVNTPRVTDAYKSGLSPIYRSTNDGNYSIQFTTGKPACAGTNTFWVPHRYTAPTGNPPTTSPAANPCGGAWQATAWNNGSGVTQQDWSQLWSVVRVAWVARQLYARSGVSSNDYNAAMGRFVQGQFTNWQAMDAILSTNCTAARTAGVEIYGIAFTAGTIGQAAINDCASSPKSNYYYDAANNAALLTAFRQIAANISELRLTQ